MFYIHTAAPSTWCDTTRWWRESSFNFLERDETPDVTRCQAAPPKIRQLSLFEASFSYLYLMTCWNSAVWRRVATASPNH